MSFTLPTLLPPYRGRAEVGEHLQPVGPRNEAAHHWAGFGVGRDLPPARAAAAPRAAAEPRAVPAPRAAAVPHVAMVRASGSGCGCDCGSGSGDCRCASRTRDRTSGGAFLAAPTSTSGHSQQQRRVGRGPHAFRPVCAERRASVVNVAGSCESKEGCILVRGAHR